jgi:hypothetical protein
MATTAEAAVKIELRILKNMLRYDFTALSVRDAIVLDCEYRISRGIGTL